MQTNFSSVGEFNRMFGHPSHNELQLNILKDKKLIKLRLDLISEEIRELNEAIEQRNLIEIIDALCDILYVVYGMGQVTGINLDKSFYSIYSPLIDGEVPKTNFEIISKMMEKFLPETGSIEENINLLTYTFKSIMNNFIKLENATNNENFNDVENYLVMILFETYKFGCIIRIDLNTAFKIVHESNMSKLCRNEKEAIESIEHYSTLDDFKNIKVDYRRSEVDPNYFVVYNKETGKILKSKYFKQPNFSTLISRD
jgi:predicted HAD superfamily Cof-like phosphohydrolase